MPLLIDVRKLSIINQLIQSGAQNVTTSLETLAGVDASVEIKSLSFVEPSDITAEMGAGEIYGAHVRLTEPPYGVFLMTFSPETAAEIAALLTNTSTEDGFNQLHESALSEMCNVLTSGFIDGIANTLETTIDFGTPELERDRAPAIAEDALTHVRRDSMSIVLDSVVDIADSDVAFKLRIFLVPDPGSFVHVIDQLELDRSTSRPKRSKADQVEELDMSADDPVDLGE